MISHGGLAPNGKASSHGSLNHSAHDLSAFDLDLDAGFQHSEQNSFSDSGPHREMAIDCPETFVATVKTPTPLPPACPELGHRPSCRRASRAPDHAQQERGLCERQGED